jgi:hypothetical protein
MKEKMFKAYDAANRILKDTLPKDTARLLRKAGSADVIVVAGCYDHVESVLDLLEIKHTLVPAGAVKDLDLRPEQLLIINCPGQIGRRGARKVRKFVKAGGSLFTTDWALKHVLEAAFPGYVEYNEQPTADAVVRIEVKDHDNPFLEGVFDASADPLWWLEGSSYPIRVLDREKVKVLINSKELGEQYGEAPVAVTFEVGDGEVFHMISHYYLQRTETRTARHESSWAMYAAEKGTAAFAAAPPELKDLTTSEVESAYSSARLFTNVVAQKRRKVEKRQAPTS